MEPSPSVRGRLGCLPTRRELEVLGLVAGGHSTKEIAQRLFLANETVKSHIKHLLAKFEARNRAHAVAIALRSGFID